MNPAIHRHDHSKVPLSFLIQPLTCTAMLGGWMGQGAQQFYNFLFKEMCRVGLVSALAEIPTELAHGRRPGANPRVHTR